MTELRDRGTEVCMICGAPAVVELGVMTSSSTGEDRYGSCREHEDLAMHFLFLLAHAG